MDGGVFDLFGPPEEETSKTAPRTGTVGPLAAVADEVIVADDACVIGCARITGHVVVRGRAKVGGFAWVMGPEDPNAPPTVIEGDTVVGGLSEISGGTWSSGSVTDGAWDAPGSPARRLRPTAVRNFGI